MTDKQKQLIMAYKTAFSTDAGKMVLDDLKKKGNLNRSHFVPSATGEINTNLLIYDEARRALVLGILAKVDYVIDKPVRTAITGDDND